MLKVSIITTSLNSASTLRDTLASVASQTYPSVEHILADGGSTDATLILAAEFPHIATVSSEPDEGIYFAMNKGLSLATGDVVAFLNSDDYYTNPSVLADMMAPFQDERIGAAYADLKYVSATDTSKIFRIWKSGAYKPNRWLKGWMPPHPTFFVRRSLITSSGGFNTQLRASADYELMLRLLFKDQVAVVYVAKTIVHMRTGGQSNASIRSRVKAIRECHQAWQMSGLDARWYTQVSKVLQKLPQFVSAKL